QTLCFFPAQTRKPRGQCFRESFLCSRAPGHISRTAEHLQESSEDSPAVHPLRLPAPESPPEVKRQSRTEQYHHSSRRDQPPISAQIVRELLQDTSTLIRTVGLCPPGIFSSRSIILFRSRCGDHLLQHIRIQPRIRSTVAAVRRRR